MSKLPFAVPPALRRAFLPCGLAAAVFYLAHVLVGGWLWNGYDHLRQPISDLTGNGAPNRDPVQAIAGLYGLFALAFAAAFLVFFARGRGRLLVTGAILFVCLHLVSLSYGLFPQDLPGQTPTFGGMMHLAVTALIVPFTIGSPLVIGLGLRKLPGARAMARLSIACGIAIFMFGGLTGAAFATRFEFFGLIERLNIGTLQAWTAVLSVWAWRRYPGLSVPSTGA